MNTEKETTYYQVPTNVSTRFEFLPGFGWYELKFVLIAVAIGSIFTFLLGLPSKTVMLDSYYNVLDMSIEANKALVHVQEQRPIIPPFFQYLPTLIFGAMTYLFVKVEPSTGRSTWTMLKSLLDFKKKQKRYIYKYKSGTEE